MIDNQDENTQISPFLVHRCCTEINMNRMKDVLSFAVYFFPLSSVFIYFNSTGTNNIQIPGNVPHSVIVSVITLASICCSHQRWIWFSDKLVRINLIDSTAQMLLNQCQEFRMRRTENKSQRMETQKMTRGRRSSGTKDCSSLLNHVPFSVLQRGAETRITTPVVLSLFPLVIMIVLDPEDEDDSFC